MTETLSQAIVVLHPFRTYKKGDTITDVETITALRASVLSSNFVVTSIPVTVASPGNTK